MRLAADAEQAHRRTPVQWITLSAPEGLKLMGAPTTAEALQAHKPTHNSGVGCRVILNPSLEPHAMPA
jgi:hypothetical protein